MKKTGCYMILFLMYIWSTFYLIGQQEIEHEYVQVLNIEMLVRVMKDGLPIAGLKEGGFYIY